MSKAVVEYIKPYDKFRKKRPTAYICISVGTFRPFCIYSFPSKPILDTVSGIVILCNSLPANTTVYNSFSISINPTNYHCYKQDHNCTYFYYFFPKIFIFNTQTQIPNRLSEPFDLLLYPYLLVLQ